VVPGCRRLPERARQLLGQGSGPLFVWRAPRNMIRVVTDSLGAAARGHWPTVPVVGRPTDVSPGTDVPSQHDDTAG